MNQNSSVRRQLQERSDFVRAGRGRIGNRRYSARKSCSEYASELENRINDQGSRRHEEKRSPAESENLCGSTIASFFFSDVEDQTLRMKGRVGQLQQFSRQEELPILGYS